MSTTYRFSVAEYDRMIDHEVLDEYWIVNVPESCLEIFRQPRDGEYRQRQTLRVGESIAPLAVPEATLDVGRLFLA